MNANNIVYFDSFGVEHIPKEIKKIIGNKDLIMRGYFCIRFIDFILSGKSLFDYTNLFSPIDYEKNDKITLKYFQ